MEECLIYPPWGGVIPPEYFPLRNANEDKSSDAETLTSLQDHWKYKSEQWKYDFNGENFSNKNVISASTGIYSIDIYYIFDHYLSFVF